LITCKKERFITQAWNISTPKWMGRWSWICNSMSNSSQS